MLLAGKTPFRPHSVIKDPRGTYLYASPEVFEDFKINPVDLIGATDLDLPSQEPYGYSWMVSDLLVMKEGRSDNIVQGICCQGSPGWMRSFKAPLIGRTGKIQGITIKSIPLQSSNIIPLTNQQLACLKELALGYTFKQIGRNLGLTEKTVEHYIRAVKARLNIHTRAELIAEAIARGLVGCL